VSFISFSIWILQVFNPSVCFWVSCFGPQVLISKLFFRCLNCVCKKETPEPIKDISVLQSQSFKKISLVLVSSDFVTWLFIFYKKHNRKRTGNSRFRRHKRKGEEWSCWPIRSAREHAILAGQRLNEDSMGKAFHQICCWSILHQWAPQSANPLSKLSKREFSILSSWC